MRHYSSMKIWAARSSFMLANKLATPTCRQFLSVKWWKRHITMIRRWLNLPQWISKPSRLRDPVDKYSTPLLYLKGFHALQGIPYRQLAVEPEPPRAGYLPSEPGFRDILVWISTRKPQNRPRHYVWPRNRHCHRRNGGGENDVSILQSVTLGGTGKTGGDRHPKSPRRRDDRCRCKNPRQYRNRTRC